MLQQQNSTNPDLGSLKRSQAIAQLRLLGYQDGDRVNYRAFLPHKPRVKVADQGRKASAVLPALPQELPQWEAEGRGIYVVVNPGGHRDGDITHGIAIWYEHDDLGKEASLALWQGLGLPEPTFQVDTGGKSVHSYWVLSEAVSPDQWRSLQTDLLEYSDGDRKLKNPSRVMRLAGYQHPETGQQAQIISQGGQRYSYEQLRAIVPQRQTQQRSTWTEFDKAFTLPWPGAVPLEACISRANRELLAAGVAEGGRNDGGAKLARDLLGTTDYLYGLGQRFDGDPRGLFEAYCDRCQPPLPEPEREIIWRSAESATPGPALSPEQIDGCIKGAAWRQSKQPAPAPQPAPVAPAPAPAKEEKRDRGSVSEPPKLAVKFRAVEAFLGEHLALNELTNQIELDGEVIEDPADLRLTLALDHGLAVSQADCEAIVKRLAKVNSYHPVKEYLEACSSKHGSSTTILDRLAERYFGCNEPIYQTFLKKTLVGAVARILEPGCKVDTALILQGAQGFGKSSFFRVLAGSDWFDDSMGAATSEKDERLKLHQFWFLEWGELEAVFKRKDIAAVKAFLSCQIDTVRPPYGRNAISLKRRSIIVGSTNQDEFLTDNTGNRRFWVVPVRKRVNLEALAQERDRIWAAAVALYQAGETCFLNADEEAIAAEFNEFYKTEDPWTSAIRVYLRDNSRGEITTSELLTHALRIEVGQQSRGHEMRVGEVLKSLGWTRTERRIEHNGSRRRVWVEPDPIPTSEVGILPVEVGISPETQTQQAIEPKSQPSTRSQPAQPAQPPSAGRDTPESPPYQGFGGRSQLTQPLTPTLSNFFQNGHKQTPEVTDISDDELAELLGGDAHG